MKLTSSTMQIPQQLGNTANQGRLSQNGQSQALSPSFSDRLADGLKQVANAQNSAATMAQNYELGLENDLAKVMVGQQVSSLAFQLTLNVRNKALSAYKDIMNMPV